MIDQPQNSSITDGLHVIFGTGPVGQWTARSLREKGLPVRVVNRSGNRPEFLPTDVEVVAADASDPAQAVRAAEGATVVYQALNPRTTSGSSVSRPCRGAPSRRPRRSAPATCQSRTSTCTGRSTAP